MSLCPVCDDLTFPSPLYPTKQITFEDLTTSAFHDYKGCLTCRMLHAIFSALGVAQKKIRNVDHDLWLEKDDDEGICVSIVSSHHMERFTIFAPPSYLLSLDHDDDDNNNDDDDSRKGRKKGRRRQTVNEQGEEEKEERIDTASGRHVRNTRDDIYNKLKSFHPRERDTSSRQSLLWAKHRLEHCLANHTANLSCSKKENSSLPTRILDLGEPKQEDRIDDDGEDHEDEHARLVIKLHESQKEDKGSYVCLSHCWGSGQPTKLTRANLEQYRRGEISWSSLPKSFQDAIVFTYQLGIRYLWIDSLCIVQDDRDDWQREAVQMSSVFENSLLTLAAAHGEDSHSGCFSRGSEWIQGFRVRASGSWGDPKTSEAQRAGTDDDGIPNETKHEEKEEDMEVWVRQQISHQELSNPGNINSPYPLLRRGWVYQERLLAPRLLYFTPSELEWECAQQAECECSGVTIGDLPKRAHHARLQSGSLVEIIMAWYEMVSDFTSLSLTFASDRLPAISGLAKQLRRHRTGRYWAGLWEDSFVADLMWIRGIGSMTTTRTRTTEPRDEWRAPTWSWASVEDSSVGYYFFGDDPPTPLCEIVEVSVTPVGTDPFGELLSAHLMVSGFLASTSPSEVEYESSNDVDDKMIYLLKLAQVHYSYGDQTCSLVLRCLDYASQTYERIGLRCGKRSIDTCQRSDAAWKTIKII